jgi:hypothetical protein
MYKIFTNKKQSIFLILILTIIVGSFYFISYEKTQSGDWLTTTDPSTNLRFKYPKNLLTAYIKEINWPPKIQILNEPFICIESGNETYMTEKTERRIINGGSYCVTTVSEGAAGSTYTQYTYAFPQGRETLLLTFSLRFFNCENYERVQVQECQYEQKNFNMDNTIDYIVNTIIPTQ